MGATKDLVLRTLPRTDELAEEQRLDRQDAAANDEHDPVVPLLTIPADHRPLVTRINGVEVALVTWAVIPRAKADAPAALLHLSAVGPHAQLKGLWAHLLHVPARIVALPGGGQSCAILRASRLSSVHGHYRTLWNAAPLPMSGQSHLSLTHDVALDAGTGAGVALLQPLHELLDVTLVVALLDRHLALPLPSMLSEPTTVLQLWEQAVSAGAVTPLPAYGCRAFWLATEHPAWPQLLIAALQGQSFDATPPPYITTVGSAYTVSIAITAVDDEEAETDDNTFDQKERIV